MKKRDKSIDVLRGLAIFSMIAANMAAKNFEEPHPFVFRLFGSFAAPTFVFLSGYMVSAAGAAAGYGFLYYLKRAAATLLVAALMDVFLWGLLPFVSFDVLYVIALSLPLVWLLGRLNKWFLLIAGFVFFAFTPFMQQLIPYQDLPNEIGLDEEGLFSLFREAPLIKNLLSYGWFPLFPWVGVSCMGAFVAKLRMEFGVQKMQKPLLIIGFALLLCGIILWTIMNPELMTREGYSELFYPPTIPFFLVYAGFILVLLMLLYELRNLKALYVFAIYGRSSLLMYILHTITIVFFFNRNFEAAGADVFIQLWLMNAFFLWWTAAFVQTLKERVKRLPFALRFIFGG